MSKLEQLGRKGKTPLTWSMCQHFIKQCAVVEGQSSTSHCEQNGCLSNELSHLDCHTSASKLRVVQYTRSMTGRQSGDGS